MQGYKIISSTLKKIVLLYYKLIIYKSPNKPLSLRALLNPNQSLFLVMSPSTNTRSGLPISTETTTLDIYSLASYSVTQTEFATTIQAILGKLKKDIMICLH